MRLEKLELINRTKDNIVVNWSFVDGYLSVADWLNQSKFVPSEAVVTISEDGALSALSEDDSILWTGQSLIVKTNDPSYYEDTVKNFISKEEKLLEMEKIVSCMVAEALKDGQRVSQLKDPYLQRLARIILSSH